MAVDPRKITHFHLKVSKWRSKSSWSSPSLILLIFSFPIHQACFTARENQNVGRYSSYTKILPEFYHPLENKLLSSKDQNGLHLPHVTLSYHHNGVQVYIDLKLNDGLLPDGRLLHYQIANNSTGHVMQQFIKTDVDLCHYQGSIRGNPESIVVVSTCNGAINGIIYDGIETYNIKEGPDGRSHYLFLYSDTSNNEHIRARERKGYNNSQHHAFPRLKRSYGDNNYEIRYPYIADEHSSYVEVMIVVANDLFQVFGKNTRRMHQHCLDIINVVNALYAPLKIFVALVGVQIWDKGDEIKITDNADETLKTFLDYRLRVLPPNDNAQLLTMHKFSNFTMGKAPHSTMCTQFNSGGVIQDDITNYEVASVASIMAHEIGHTLGMSHDESHCECRDKYCIMGQQILRKPPIHWSRCSLDQLNVAFAKGIHSCLRNKPKRLFGSPVCGNMFVEPGEQCDCGSPGDCANSCCNPHTCQLYANATCATGKCCDLRTCLLKSAGTLCREANGECDLPEYCSGDYEFCPDNVFKRDTEECDNGLAFCYDGRCRSHTTQCRIVWGPRAESWPDCYTNNLKGSRFGNCGWDQVSGLFSLCAEEDKLCGMLQCRYVDDELATGSLSGRGYHYDIFLKDNLKQTVECSTAKIDFGTDTVDPGMTPNGAKCGEQKMCLNQQCRSITELRASGIGRECPQNCNGRGVCNSRGHCHCHEGFSGPSCLFEIPVPRPNVYRNFLFFLYYAILPSLLIIVCIIGGWYVRKHCRRSGSQLLVYFRTPMQILKSKQGEALSTVTSSGKCLNLNVSSNHLDGSGNSLHV